MLEEVAEVAEVAEVVSLYTNLQITLPSFRIFESLTRSRKFQSTVNKERGM